MRHRKHYVKKEEPAEDSIEENYDKQEIDFLQIIADDKSLITYRPKLNQITNSVTATILLQQILYWWKNSKEKAFYKFKSPCQHPLYKEGDSWNEELGFTSSEFDTALRKIGCKTTKKEQNPGNKFVYYWTTRDRATFYNINKSNLAKQGILIYQNKESGFTKTRNPDLDIKSEITQKITQKNKIHYVFLDEWNKNKIIIHEKVTSKRKQLIDKVLKLKDYTQEEIFKAFQNYAEVLHSSNHYWDKIWSMEEFLQKGLNRFVDEVDPLNNFKDYSSPNKQPNQSKTKLSAAGFPLITHLYSKISVLSEDKTHHISKSTLEDWQELLEGYTKQLLNSDIWLPNYKPNKIKVFNGVVSMQGWLEKVDYSIDGGANLRYKIFPLNELITYYILCIDDWWGGWMDGVKDNVFDVNNKIFKMFIREMETSFAVRMHINSEGWVNDSDWEPRD